MEATINKKEKNISIEILRIVSMLMIIVLHFFSYTNATENLQVFSIKYFANVLIITLCNVSVNCYILISGYFGLKSKVKLKKVFELSLEVLFYSIIIYVILLKKNMIQFDFKELLVNFFPILTRQYWFMTSFIGLYLITPYLKLVIQRFTKQEYMRFLIVLFALLVVYYNLFFFCDNLNFGGATGIVWFSYMYLWGMYFDKYGKIDYTKKHLKRYIICYILLISTRLPFWILYILTKNNIFIKGASIFDSVYNSLGVTIFSFITFNMFLNIRIKPNRIKVSMINFLTRGSLAVYLIHDNKYIRNILWEKLNIRDCSWIKMIFILIGVILGIYVICSIIDWFRRKIFGLLFCNDKTENFINKIENKIKHKIYLIEGKVEKWTQSKI